MTNIKGRLNRLEAQRRQGFADVISWIRAGRFYDELTSPERQRYCDYRGSDRLGFEQVEGYFYGGLHIPLERNPTPPTSAEIAERVRFVEQWFEQAKAECNAACCE